MLEGTGLDAKGGYEPDRSPRDNGLYRSTDGGATWTKMNSINVRPFYYSQVRSDPKNPDRVYFSSTQLQVSDDGGKTSRNAAQDVHVDDHGLWIDPNDPERWAIANDGGIAHHVRQGRQLHADAEPAHRAVLRSELRHGGAVQHLRRCTGQRHVVWTEQASWRRRRRWATGSRLPAATDFMRRRIRPIRTSCTASRRAETRTG